MSTKSFHCPACLALRSIEFWHETRPETFAIGLAPCGHVIERTARLEWRVPERMVLRRSSPRRLVSV